MVESVLDMALSPHDKQCLLRLAYQAIADHLKKRDFVLSDDIPPYLFNKGAAFVTLLIEERLRGCIGSLECNDSLIECVIKNSLKAALEDPRFYPLTWEEFLMLDIEISCLSLIKQIQSIDQIEIGIHGVILEYNRCRGVFLPQVPIEHGWDKSELLENLAIKAGLDRNQWNKSGVKYSIFKTIKFSNRDFFVEVNASNFV